MSKRIDAEIASVKSRIDRRLLLAAGGGSALVAATPFKAWSQSRSSAFDDALDATFEGEKPVAMAAMVLREGTPLWSGVRGLRRFDGDVAARVSDRWHLGSNTKAMTAALWARQVQKGAAVWDMPLSTVMSMAFPEVMLHPDWADRTVDDFMRHRAGLYDANYVTPLWLMSSRVSRAGLREQRRNMLDIMLRGAPNGPRGTFQYGNANYILVGALLEGLTGQSWEELMQADVFEPLGMSTAGFGAPAGDQPWGHLGGEGARVSVSPDLPGSDNPKTLGPAGTVHMALEDYARFLQAMLTPGWLSAESLQRLTTPLDGENYAMGWIVVRGQPWAKGAVLAHDGSNTLWYMSTAIDLGAKLAVVSVSNDGTAGAKACPQLLGGLIRATLRTA